MPPLVRPRLIKVAPVEEIRWLGSIGIAGLFDGEHRFPLQPAAPSITRFTQEESFRGVLVPLLGGMIVGGACRGFQAMNQALKMRAETSLPARSP